MIVWCLTCGSFATEGDKLNLMWMEKVKIKCVINKMKEMMMGLYNDIKLLYIVDRSEHVFRHTKVHIFN